MIFVYRFVADLFVAKEKAAFCKAAVFLKYSKN
jgi:hypothetical protein